MSPPKLPPPTLERFTFIEGIAGGGFADVYLYEQHSPRRRVAIKVLRASATDEASRRQFESEVNTMASVSSHPNIVAVYQSGVAPAPDNRPYIVMEYYPPPHYGQRARDSAMSVAEVLRVGVQIASAVDFAHQNGIIHNDIKPSNVLVSNHGSPGLTDFGIASVQSDDHTPAYAISIAYASPEVASERSAGDVRSDVYSLTATIYALLAGHSPFERQGRNGYAELMHRIENEPAPPTGRSDVPRSLELLLQQGLNKRPGDRPESTASLARTLQDIQHQQHLTPTELRLDPDEVRRPRVKDDDDPTVVPPIRVQDVQAARPGAAAAPGAPPIEFVPYEADESARSEPDTRQKPSAPFLVDDEPKTKFRPQAPSDAAHTDDVRGARTKKPRETWRTVSVVVVVAAVVGVVIGIAAFRPHHGHASTTTTSFSPSEIGPVPDGPTTVAYTRPSNGTSTIRWNSASRATGYAITATVGSWRVTTNVAASKRNTTITSVPAGDLCVSVVAFNHAGMSPYSAKSGCTE